eukprot:TRINITY_DN66591_c4_g12_i2.p1 TRINITY_DN66591_c4_g12~~TRINITY_DN66591_c4_g12_i2.p1  ORF type:complete len:820 (+),score=21.10 TRINITY_DN66591_c4_g12_i2:195-2654(+)
MIDKPHSSQQLAPTTATFALMFLYSSLARYIRGPSRLLITPGLILLSGFALYAIPRVYASWWSLVFPDDATINTDPCTNLSKPCNLSNKGIAGRFRPEYLPRQMVEALVSHNQLNGSLDLTNLPAGMLVLDVSNNRFEGCTEFHRLPHMTRLHLANNTKLSGRVNPTVLRDAGLDFDYNNTRIIPSKSHRCNDETANETGLLAALVQQFIVEAELFKAILNAALLDGQFICSCEVLAVKIPVLLIVGNGIRFLFSLWVQGPLLSIPALAPLLLSAWLLSQRPLARNWKYTPQTYSEDRILHTFMWDSVKAKVYNGLQAIVFGSVGLLIGFICLAVSFPTHGWLTAVAHAFLAIFCTGWTMCGVVAQLQWVKLARKNIPELFICRELLDNDTSQIQLNIPSMKELVHAQRSDDPELRDALTALGQLHALEGVKKPATLSPVQVAAAKLDVACMRVLADFRLWGSEWPDNIHDLVELCDAAAALTKKLEEAMKPREPEHKGVSTLLYCQKIQQTPANSPQLCVRKLNTLQVEIQRDQASSVHDVAVDFGERYSYFPGSLQTEVVEIPHWNVKLVKYCGHPFRPATGIAVIGRDIIMPLTILGVLRWPGLGVPQLVEQRGQYNNQLIIPMDDDRLITAVFHLVAHELFKHNCTVDELDEDIDYVEMVEEPSGNLLSFLLSCVRQPVFSREDVFVTGNGERMGRLVESDVGPKDLAWPFKYHHPAPYTKLELCSMQEDQDPSPRVNVRLLDDCRWRVEPAEIIDGQWEEVAAAAQEWGLRGQEEFLFPWDKAVAPGTSAKPGAHHRQARQARPTPPSPHNTAE